MFPSLMCNNAPRTTYNQDRLGATCTCNDSIYLTTFVVGTDDEQVDGCAEADPYRVHALERDQRPVRVRFSAPKNHYNECHSGSKCE